MKLRQPRHTGRRRGSATLVVLGLLSIMAIYVTIQFTAALRLQSNLRLIEKRQLQRLKTQTPASTHTLLNNPDFDRVAAPEDPNAGIHRCLP
jgi:hypothetical protein